MKVLLNMKLCVSSGSAFFFIAPSLNLEREKHDIDYELYL